MEGALKVLGAAAPELLWVGVLGAQDGVHGCGGEGQDGEGEEQGCGGEGHACWAGHCGEAVAPATVVLPRICWPFGPVAVNTM